VKLHEIGDHDRENAVIAVPDSWLMTRKPSPERGSTTSNWIPDNAHDNSQTMTSSKTNSIAGSGSLLPALSTAPRMRSMRLTRGAFSFAMSEILRLSHCTAARRARGALYVIAFARGAGSHSAPMRDRHGWRECRLQEQLSARTGKA
jgi:hypothetical protein